MKLRPARRGAVLAAIAPADRKQAVEDRRETITPPRRVFLHRFDLLERHGPAALRPDPHRGIAKMPRLVVVAKDGRIEELRLAVALLEAHLSLFGPRTHLGEQPFSLLPLVIFGPIRQIRRQRRTHHRRGGEQANSNDRAPHARTRLHGFSYTATAFSSRSTKASESRLSARAWQLSTKRCRSTGAATA